MPIRHLALLALLTSAPVLRADDEFFEKKVRPILADNCYSCHGPKKQNAGLRLDTREGFMKGSDAGPIVVAGKPDASLLIKVVRYEGESQMPPKGKLPADAVAALTEWVRLGAAYPAGSTAPTMVDTKKHWAFQPVANPVPPIVKSESLVRTPIDRFVLAKLEANGQRLSPEADRRTLIRRVSYTLVGLPPTAEEVEAFAADTDPKAYEKLVDRLLASPHYGERWARHWLDLSRYSDTKGYVFTEDRNYPYAYTYRDYVINAFNADKPYDQFIVEQLAGDQVDLTNDRTPLAAMGFLTLGRRFLNSQPDIIDDRIDVVTRGLLGMTVTCARCHDHKFDPVPAADYYSLYGVFASSTEPKELPMITDPKRTAELAAFDAELKKLQGAADAYPAQLRENYLAELRTPASVRDYLLASRVAPGPVLDVRAAYRREKDLSDMVIRRWREAIKAKAKEFAPWTELAQLPDAKLAADAPAVIAKHAAAGLNPALARALADAKPKTVAELADAYAGLLVRSLTDKSKELDAIRAIMTGKDAPVEIPLELTERLFTLAEMQQATVLRKAADQLRAKSPAAPPRAMALADLPNPVEPVVFVRGNPNNRGAQVKRQFLGAISGTDRKPFTKGSGRLELAQSIASPTNPMTARVFVNRVWLNHFGRGLVNTPSDFGVRSEPPTHPEMLDYLASKFVANGWSVKKLHREILLSAAFRQSSADPTGTDPENRQLGRMNRRRLDFESLRDSLLAVGGQLDRAVGGRSVDIFAAPFTGRRTVYAYIDRQNLPGTFRTFDLALPDTHAPQRFQTTVPQQALFLMNSPFVIGAAKSLAGRDEVAKAKDTPEKVRQLYRAAYGRSPTAEEQTLAEAFVAGGHTGVLNGWEELAQVLLLSNEFAFVD